MAIQIRHQGHLYTYLHPAGWTGGDELFRKKLNEACPAGEYPAHEAEELAARHALAGILAGGAVVRQDPEHHLHPSQARPEGGEEENRMRPAGEAPGRILAGEAPVEDPNRILGSEPGMPASDPGRILGDELEED